MKRNRPILVSALCATLVVASCGSDPSTAEVDDGAFPPSGADSVTLLTHDSFVLPEEQLIRFEDENDVTLEVVQVGDAGTLVANAIATAGDPTGDVLFGVDNLLLGRALAADLFEPYESSELSEVDQRFVADTDAMLTPVDHGYVCVNYRADSITGEPPTSMDDLRTPELAPEFVTQNPESSTPGLAFLYATIARYGEDGWQEYWRDLRDNGVTITSGWSESYEGFYVGGGSGDKGIVNSYASSPVFEGLFGEGAPVSDILVDSCFEQIEYAGILRGASAPDVGAKLIDFLLSPEVQAEIPLSMFVEPVNANATVPEDFARYTVEVPDPLSLEPSDIAANQARWTQEWVEIFRE